MATVNLSPYTAESEAIARKLRMAEALGQKAAQPLEMPTMPGVKISPYAGLAKIFDEYIAGRDERAAKAESKYAPPSQDSNILYGRKNVNLYISFTEP